MKATILFICLFISVALMGQSGNKTLVAVNDTVSTIQPNADTINIVANDTAFDGDSICLSAVFGPPNFGVLNCTSVVFTPDTNFTGKDSCWYVICDTGGSGLCDTGMIIVNVSSENTVLPLLENGKVWNVCETYGEPNESNGANYLTFFLEKDTLIGSLSYRTVEEYISYYYPNSPPDSFVAGWIREDSLGRVYFLEQNLYGQYCSYNDTSENLLYHFSLTIGDSILSGDGRWVYANYIDTVIIHGIVRKRWSFTNSCCCHLGFDTIIEGIGSSKGPLYPRMVEFEEDYSLMCVTIDTTTLYPNGYGCHCGTLSISNIPPPTLKIYPNPATDELLITASGFQPEQLSIYDVSGKTVIEEKYHPQIDIGSLSAGLYFIEVKGNGFTAMNRFVKQ